MGAEQQQEVKSLPRNRKCGNCRYFEPAPLWRKGWCRNPQLYPPHANHLVDSSTIDCEGGFRSRIYWEPIPQAQVTQPMPTPADSKQPAVNRVANFEQKTEQADFAAPPPTQARSGSFGPKFETRTAPQPQAEVRNYRATPVEPIVSEAQYKPLEDNYYYDEEPEQQAEYRRQTPIEIPSYQRLNEPKAKKAERTAYDYEPQPQPEAKPKTDLRETLYRNFPFTQNWDLERFKLQTVLPWLAVGLFALLFLMFFIGSNRGNTGVPLATDNTGNATAAASTADTSGQSLVVTATPSGSTSSTPATSKTSTASSAASGTVNATTTTVASVGSSVAGKTATVNSPDGINMRKDPSTSGQVIKVLKKGDKVTIVDGPKTSDGLDWYQVKVANQTGWVAKQYIDVAA